MTLKKRLTTMLPAGKKRMRILILCLLSLCVLLCGFSWGWVIEFTAPVIFPPEDAVDSALVFDFGEIVNTDDLRMHLTDPLIAEQLRDGIRANISGNVYSNIEIPDMREENLGSKIIRIIFDRLFT